VFDKDNGYEVDLEFIQTAWLEHPGRRHKNRYAHTLVSIFSISATVRQTSSSCQTTAAVLYVHWCVFPLVLATTYNINETARKLIDAGPEFPTRQHQHDR
jgi:hypothetical protein